MGYHFFWLMDDDTIPERDALETLLKADRELDGTYGFLSSRVFWKDGSACKMNLQKDTFFHTLNESFSKQSPVIMASFVSLFLQRDIVSEIGLPIKEFFIWTDDWEYTRRISRKYPCYFIPSSTVIHKSKSNIGASIVTESVDRLDRFDYLYRNDVYLYRREGWKGFCYEALRLPYHCIRVLLESKDNKRARIGKIVLGTFAGLHFHPEIEYPSERRPAPECDPQARQTTKRQNER